MPVMAYSPLGGERLVHDPTLARIGAAHDCSRPRSHSPGQSGRRGGVHPITTIAENFNARSGSGDRRAGNRFHALVNRARETSRGNIMLEMRTR